MEKFFCLVAAFPATFSVFQLVIEGRQTSAFSCTKASRCPDQGRTDPISASRGTGSAQPGCQKAVAAYLDNGIMRDGFSWKSGESLLVLMCSNTGDFTDHSLKPEIGHDILISAESRLDSKREV